MRIFFAFLQKRRPNRYCFREEHLVFHMQIFSLMCQSVKLLSKVAVQNIGCVSTYFCGEHKNNRNILKPGTSQKEPKPTETTQNNCEMTRYDPKVHNWGNLEFFTSVRCLNFEPKCPNLRILGKEV